MLSLGALMLCVCVNIHSISISNFIMFSDTPIEPVHKCKLRDSNKYLCLQSLYDLVLVLLWLCLVQVGERVLLRMRILASSEYFD
jgi:hypothetical protein